MRNAVQPNHEVQPAPVPGAEIVPFDPLRGRDRQAARLARLVAEATGVPPMLLFHPSRCGAEVAEARQLAMYLMHVVLGRTYLEVARYFRRDRSTVSYACARIEDERDSPAFEAFVASLESVLTAAPATTEARDAAR